MNDQSEPLKQPSPIAWLDQKPAEGVSEELRQARAAYQSIVDSLPLNLLIKDSQGRRVFANKSYLELRGASLADIVGKTDFDLFPAALAQQFSDDDAAILNSGKPMHDVEKHQLADGQQRWIERTKSALRDADGQIVGVQLLFWDVTDREQALIDSREARDAADAANRSKSDFLANMSHEIRTPMNGILGMTDLVLDTQLTPTQREYLQMSQESGENLLAIINDILDFSKIEAGHLELDPTPFAPHDSLGDAVSSLRIRAQTKGLELTFSVAPEVPQMLEGDLGRLRQVLVNLIGNAIKFTDRGEVVLDVSCQSKSQSTCTLLFSVRDTGIGIPADKQARIFEDFQQADRSTTRSHGGTGLGLAISSQLVKLMGGRIEVDSAPGRGSTFHFTVDFPIINSTDQEQTPNAPVLDVASNPLRSDAPTQKAVSPLESVRVLVAEDNKVNQTLVMRLLEKLGCQVTVVENGKQALAALSENEFDIILMDVEMPEMDGMSATMEIRRREQDSKQHTPIVAVTAHAIVGDHERCLACGMDDYLSKPLRINEIKAMLTKILLKE